MYETNDLLDRLYNKIGNNGIRGKIILPKPVSGILNRKTYLNNYNEIKNKIEREHVQSLISFIKKELSAEVSLNSENQLIITGIFKNASFEKIIKNYCIMYVQCISCKGGNTEIIKENKILYIVCKSCKSKKAI
jgi:translation initiation factor 2 beta subunit (eIF-2beta)/eIF-5